MAEVLTEDPGAEGLSAARLPIKLHANNDAPPQRWKTSEAAGEGVATNMHSVNEGIRNPVYQLAVEPGTLQPEGLL